MKKNWIEIIYIVRYVVINWFILQGGKYDGTIIE